MCLDESSGRRRPSVSVRTLDRKSLQRKTPARSANRRFAVRASAVWPYSQRPARTEIGSHLVIELAPVEVGTPVDESGRRCVLP